MIRLQYTPTSTIQTSCILSICDLYPLLDAAPDGEGGHLEPAGQLEAEDEQRDEEAVERKGPQVPPPHRHLQVQPRPDHISIIPDICVT